MKEAGGPGVVLALVSVGAFVGQLDATIVQLALPTLGRSFGASLSQVSWVALAYLLAFAACLPVFGRLCETMGRKQLYLAGYLIFISASVLCGLAQSLEMLIAFRILQGIGGSLLGANSIAILVAATPPDRRGRALGIFAAAQAVGMSAGPAVGGLVLDSLGWPWLFWLSVPVGLVAAVLGWRFLPATPASDPAAPFDWRGALLVGPAVAALVFALNHAADSARALVVTLAAVVASAVLFRLLVQQERRTRRPLVDLRLFASRAFAAGSLAVILGYAMLYGMFFLMSFALEHGRGDSAAMAGLRLAVLPVAIGLAAPLAGMLSDRIGAGAPALAGMGLCLFAVVLLMLSGGGYGATTLAFASYGAGLGLFIAPANHLTLDAAPAGSAGQASAMLNLLRALGTSLGVAGATAMLGWRLAAEGGSTEAWASLPGSALLDAVGQSLLLLAGMAAVAILAVLRAGRGQPPGRPTQAAEPPTVRPPISIDG